MIRFHIPGMTCGGCLRSITAAIHGVDAGARIDADIPAKSVSVESPADRAALVAAIREAGYEVQGG